MDIADEHSRSALIALERGVPGEVYNIGSGHEQSNLEVVREIVKSPASRALRTTGGTLPK